MNGANTKCAALRLAWAMAMCLLFSGLVLAQGQGQNTVYSASGTTTGSMAFIDASQFVSSPSSNNICAVLNYVLSHGYPSGGAVVDARGLNSGNTHMTCATTAPTNPWGTGSSYLNVPSVILLPAGTIQISATWILPSKTRLIGEGDGINSSATYGTTIQATSSFSGNMIQFGASSTCIDPGSVCNEISVENLTLDGQGDSVTGISNQYSQDRTFVDHVGLVQIIGTGLSVGGNATNSGPYSNIRFDTASSGASGTVCVNVNGLTATRGFHGISCTARTILSQSAILLDSSNNTLEDIRVIGFYDGVVIGANATAQSNVLLNVIGDTDPNPYTLQPVNTVHISNANTVTDVSLMGISNTAIAGTYTLQDDITGPHLSDATLAVYALGTL